MADQIQIVELLVDSGPAIAGAEAVIPPLEAIAVAAQATAASVDKLGISLDALGASGRSVGTQAAASAAGTEALAGSLGRVGSAARSGAADIKAGEDALIRQATAAGGNLGMMVQLERALNQTNVALDAQLPLMTRDALSKAAASEEIARLTERQNILKSAITELGKEGGSAAAVLAQWPNLFNTSAASATKLTAAQKEMAAALNDLGKGNISLTSFLEKHPGLLNAATAGTAIFSGAQKEAKAALEDFSKQHLSLSELISKHPGLMSAAAAATNTLGTSTRGLGSASRDARTDAANLGAELENVGTRATGTSGKVREAAVLVREISRGDLTRLLGSASIELNNFGLLGLVFNPIVLGAVALGTALAVAVTRASTLQQELRQFQTGINFFQPGGAGTPGQSPQYLQGLTQQLIDQGGIGRSNAFSLVTQALQTGLNTDLLPQITQVGKALEKLFGGDSTEWSQKFIHALNGGFEALRTFGLETHTLDAGTIDDLHDIALTGDNLALKQTALQAALKSTADVMKTATAPGKEAAESIGVAWDHALNALANTTPIEKAREALVGVLNVITEIAKGPQANATAPGGGAIPEGADLAAINAARRAQGLPPLASTGAGAANAPSLGELRSGSYGQVGPFAAIGANAIPGGGASIGGLAIGSTGLVEIVSATLDALSSASPTQLGSVAAAVRSAQGNAVGGLEVGGATSSAIDTQKTTIDANTDAVKTLTLTLNQSADKIGNLVPGGAIAGAAGSGFLGALAQLESGGQNVTQRIQDINSRAGTPAQGYFQITDPTWRQFAPPAILNQFSSALQAPFDVQQAVAANIPLNRFGPRTVSGLQAQFGSLDTSLTIGQLAGGIPSFSAASAIGSNAAQVAAQQDRIGFDAGFGRPTFTTDTFGGTLDKSQVAELNAQAGIPSDQPSLDRFNQYVTTIKTTKAALGEEGVQAALTNAANQALNQNVSEHITGWAAWANVVVHQKAVLDQYAGSNEVAASQNTRAVAGLNSVATAYGKSAVEAEIASAATEAQTKVINQNANAGQVEIQILSLRTAQALQYGAQRINASAQQLTADQRLADASAQGTRALQEQQIANKAIADTLDVRTKAAALLKVATDSGSDADKAAAQAALTRANAEQQKAQEIEHAIAVTQQQTAINRQITGAQDETQVLQLQLDLQGRNSSEIDKQVNLLRARQEINRQIIPDTEEERTTLADSNNHLLSLVAHQGDLRIAIQRASQEQNGFNEAIKKAADAVGTTLTTAIANMFDPQKPVDWGKTILKIIAQIAADIANIEFIRPLTGTILSALGLSGAAKGFGSFNDLLGGGGGGIDPVSGLSNATTSGTSTSLLGSLGQIGSAVGGLSKLGSLFSGGGLGSLLGASTDVGATIAGTGGLTAQALLDAAPTAAAGAGLVSETALSAGGISSALSGAGSALSGIGSVLGSVIPFVGPLVGVVSLIGGLFGNKKPSLASSGDVLDLTSNSISGFSSSGNAQNDAAVRQISASLQSFVKSIQQQTGGTVPTGDLNVVATTKGIETHYSGALGKIDAKFADAQSAISGLELAITQNLTGVSDTLKAVLANVTDPSQIQAAVTFATTYDNLKKAADSAFSSISTDTFHLGPFATALANLQKTFGDLTTQANQFGLSLDPINAGLAEATKRLQTDFGTSLDQALNTANASDFVNQLQAVSKTFAVNSQEAQALGLSGDAGTQAKIAQIEATQAAAILAPLTADQLQTVITKLGQTNPEISSMAQAILSAGLAATGATASLTNLATGIKAVEDLANSLRGGQLSGLPPAQAAAAAGGTYQASLSAALAAGKNVTSDQLSAVATSGAAAIQASQAAFGQGPQTAALRAQILGGLGQVTAITGPSSAIQTTATPASVAQGAIAASPTVQAAQVSAVIAALHAAGVPGYALGTRSSLPGAILVGESGPEIITQPGGLSITPISAHPGWSWQGGSASNSGSSSGVAAMLSELQALRGEVMALRKQTQGGQVADGTAMQTQNTILANIDRKAGPGVVQPMRQRMGR